MFRIAAAAILHSTLLVRCGKLDQRSAGARGIFVSDLKILGTKTLSMEQIDRIASAMIGFCFNEDNDDSLKAVNLHV